MALYLGSEKVSATLGGSLPSGIKCVTGTATSDNYGIVTFPELDFTPAMIAVWNVKKIDWAEKDEDWDGTKVQYTHVGVMLMAINQNGTWISQGIMDNSGGIQITNSSGKGGTQEFLPTESASGISVNGNVYSYLLCRYSDQIFGENGNHDITNTEFNYAIYG